jgi:hypothetical protein
MTLCESKKAHGPQPVGFEDERVGVSCGNFSRLAG